MIKWFTKGVNPLVLVWAFLSALLIICIYFFRINDYVANPQHGHFDTFDEVTKYIQENGRVGWYRAYFIIDFVWAFFFLSIIGYVVMKTNEHAIAVKKIKLTMLQIFIFCAFFAYIFDCLEGVGYLFYWDSYLWLISSIKLVLYALCIGFFLYWILKKYVFTDFRSIFRFVQTAILSIVFIVIIYLLLTAMPQGGTLVVDLFYNPINIVLLFILLTFLALMISHFPVYVDIWLHGNNKNVELEMVNRRINFAGLGIIYYNTGVAYKNNVKGFGSQRVNALRRSLGILLYIAVFHIFLMTATRYFETEIYPARITLILFVITLLIYNAKGQDYNYWKQILNNPNSSEKDCRTVITYIVKYVRGFTKYFILCIFLVMLSAVVAWISGWNRFSVVLVLITLAFQMYLYIYFKITRTYFKYVFYSEALKEYNPDMFNDQMLGMFDTYDTDRARGERWYLDLYAKLSDNVRYLTLMQVTGISSFVVLVVANFSFTVAVALNPVVIILLYIIFFYSAMIILFKHVLYYHRNKKAKSKFREFYKFGIPVIVLLLMGWAAYSTTLDNDLHQLSLVPLKEKPMSAKQYFSERTADKPKTKKENYFFVGSYGGGLKANLWNLLLFNELDKKTDNGFLENTMVMSGVSGGAVGIANYASLVREIEDQNAREQAIFNIGTSNVLSNELVYLMGKDWFREYLPFTYNGRDRSFKSMQNHAYHTGLKERYNNITYSDYWREMYQHAEGKFPILIMNTTSTIGRQGVATSVQFDDMTFPAADDITSFSVGKRTAPVSLAYFAAVSTTNRFPLFSPTAVIPSKGAYLDGGYFENSGMLSTWELYESILDDKNSEYSDRIQPVFVNIINSKDYYIAHKVLKDWSFKKASQDKTSEISAILNTVVSIDKLPRYVFDKIEKRGFAVEAIMMPHKISYDEVKAILRGDVNNPVRLMKLIKQHNDTIDIVLKKYKQYDFNKWGVVEPPLARVLSVPAVRYQEAMVKNHPEVLRALDRIEAYIITEDVVDKNFKNVLQRRPKSKNKQIVPNISPEENKKE
ncbi:MAG: hypothetical protein ABJM06_05510 [Gilvibacter sp.]